MTGGEGEHHHHGMNSPSSGNGAPRETVHVDVVPGRASERFRRLVSRDFARHHLVLSQGMDELGRELLAVSERSAPAAIFNVGVRLNAATTAFAAPDEVIARAIDAAYKAGDPGDSAQNASEADVAAGRSVVRLLEEAERDLLSTSGKAPVVRLTDALLFEGLAGRASDIHVQPLADRVLVRYRLDGVLHTARELSSAVAQAIINRIKVMGRMDVTEQRLPQDGRASVTIGTRPVDLRISILPTRHGERAVIRLLDTAGTRVTFDQLGMPAHIAEPWLRHARSAHGVALITGPTGSGKTTTLYATLQEIVTAGVNAMTIEDPVEYDLSSSGMTISQSQVNARKGVTFPTGLRHLLRQDPDVIMIGEIRDAETAGIAIQASLTGHMVFSTLHTNDACGAVTRLFDLGIERYLVADAVTAVLAQRLVRCTHASCSGTGCAECLETGYRGRLGIFELLGMSAAMRTLITAGAPPSELQAEAVRGGLRSLQSEGEALVAAGRTTRAEVARVVEDLLT